jgi:hypothetical protein
MRRSFVDESGIPQLLFAARDLLLQFRLLSLQLGFLGRIINQSIQRNIPVSVFETKTGGSGWRSNIQASRFQHGA